MESIFVVEAGVDYEGSTPVRAFAERGQADDFAKACREYECTRPPYPNDGDEAEYKACYAADKAWKDAHPAGENGSGSDYFSVTKVPFTTAQPQEPK